MKQHEPSWLRDAVFYEIYPQSFLDTNGDGIGDLPGVIAKLDYVRSLGCNAIWLNPCFVSPFGDAGYDVADFYRVAPRYGNNADLRRLFSEAKKRGIRVCLDLVAGHTSIEHPWFQASARPERNKYSDWYIWTNNWWEDTDDLPYIGGYSDRNGRCIINFFWFQPALNYGFARPNPKCPWQLPVTHPACRAVRAELKKIMRYWLDLGASGFRVDMAPSLVKKDPGHRENIRLWREMRAMLERDYPDAVLISEWGNPPQATAAGFHVDFMLPFIPENRRLFSGPENRGVVDYSGAYFHRNGRGDIAGYMARFTEFLRRSRGYPSIVSGNHDHERLNFQRTPDDLEIIFAFLLTMPGVPFVHYGDEIGLRQRQGLPSKERGYNRTAGRTPMQWTPGRNAGFSTAPDGKLYSPLDPAPDRPNVADQERQPNSLLKRVRSLIRLRHEHRALQADGPFEVLYCRPNAYPFVYRRGKFVIALNPAAKPVTVTVPVRGQWLLQRGRDVAVQGHRLRMTPVSFGIWEVGR